MNYPEDDDALVRRVRSGRAPLMRDSPIGDSAVSAAEFPSSPVAIRFLYLLTAAAPALGSYHRQSTVSEKVSKDQIEQERYILGSPLPVYAGCKSVIELRRDRCSNSKKQTIKPSA
jgi:hypothetical protein